MLLFLVRAIAHLIVTKAIWTIKTEQCLIYASCFLTYLSGLAIILTMLNEKLSNFETLLHTLNPSLFLKQFLSLEQVTEQLVNFHTLNDHILDFVLSNRRSLLR